MDTECRIVDVDQLIKLITIRAFQDVAQELSSDSTRHEYNQKTRDSSEERV